jgi:electron transport complex protein RnfB
VAVCPVDCILLDNASGARTGWTAWSAEQADQARQSHQFTTSRRRREAREHAQMLEQQAEHKLAHLTEVTHNASGPELERKRTVIEAALARARQRSANLPP